VICMAMWVRVLSELLGCDCSSTAFSLFAKNRQSKLQKPIKENPRVNFAYLDISTAFTAL
jgi:hypothetical protein